MKQTKRILSLAMALVITASVAVFAPLAMAETVDLSLDSTEPALAANIMGTSVNGGDNLTAARNFNSFTKRINAEVAFQLDSSSPWNNDARTYGSSTLEALQEINNPAGDGHAYYGTTGAYTGFVSGAFEPGKTYVFKAYIKSDGTEDAYFTNGIITKAYDTLVYSNEYGKTGKKIEAGEYSEYTTTITLPENFDQAGSNRFLSILPDGVKKGAKIRFRTENADDVYLAEEQAYRLNVSAAFNKVSIGDSLIISAEVLNQVGLKGGLNQNVTWHAMDSDRTAEVEGFVFGNNTVTVTDAVAPGAYTLVAESASGLVKGLSIEVADAVSFRDTEAPALAANIMGTSVNGGDNLTAARNFNVYTKRINTEVAFQLDQSSPWSSDARTYGSSTLEALQEINNPAGDGHAYYGTTGAHTDFVSGAFEPGKTYVFKAYIKSDGTEDAYFTNGIITKAYDTLVYSNEYGKTGKKIEAGEYSEYTTTITLPENFDQAGNNWFLSILPDGVKKGAKIRFRTENADDVYLAEEQAYRLNVSAASTSLALGETTTVSASVLNQIGTKGTLDQNVKWFAFDTDRNEKISDISIVQTADGAAVTIGENVPEGQYDIVAVSEKYGMVKGVTLKVSDNKEKISALALIQDSGYANVSASVVNCSSESVIFVLAAYNGVQLVDVSTVTRAVVNGAASVDITLEEPLENGNIVKAFVWSGAGIMKPIANLSGFDTTMVIDSAE